MLIYMTAYPFFNGRNVKLLLRTTTQVITTVFHLSAKNAGDRQLANKGLEAEEIKKVLGLSEAPDLSTDQLGRKRTGKPDIGSVEVALYEDNSGGGDDEDNTDGGDPGSPSGGGCSAGLNAVYILILAAMAFCKRKLIFFCTIYHDNII